MALHRFTTDPIKALHFAILVYPTTLNFWHSGDLALSTDARAPKCQKLKMVGKTSMAPTPLNISSLEQLALKRLKSHKVINNTAK